MTQTTSCNKRPEPDHIDLDGPYFEVSLIEFEKTEEYAELFFEIANGDLRQSSSLRILEACQKRFQAIYKHQTSEELCGNETDGLVSMRWPKDNSGDMT